MFKYKDSVHRDSDDTLHFWHQREDKLVGMEVLMVVFMTSAWNIWSWLEPQVYFLGLSQVM